MGRTGAEYIASLRDGRAVYVNGERVDDVTEHPPEIADVGILLGHKSPKTTERYASVSAQKLRAAGDALQRAWAGGLAKQADSAAGEASLRASNDGTKSPRLTKAVS